jgi:hypothetical protein
MVGERDREQEAVRWEIDDPTVIAIPPPFNNGILQYNQTQQQHYTTMGADTADEDAPGRWEDEKNYGLMCGDGMAGGYGAGASEKGVRFPETSPTQEFFSGQVLHDPLQRTHSR